MFRLFLLTTLSLSVGSIAHGAVTTWTLQSSSSTLTISGAVSSGNTLLANLISQSPGDGLTTSYVGTIETSSDIPPSSLSFVGGSILALDSGSWDPLPFAFPGTAAANYGMSVDLGFLGGVNFAIRDLVGSLGSGVIALSGSPYSSQTFDSDIDLLLTSGSMNYRSFGSIASGLLLQPPFDFTGETKTFHSAGTIDYGSMGEATMTIPVEIAITVLAAGADTTATSDDVGVYANLTGQFVATAVVPEANSLVLLGFAGSFVGFAGYRRFRGR